MQGAAQQISLFPDTESPDEALSGFSVRESGRARRLAIKVYPQGKVEVVVPKRTRSRDVEAFVTEHRDWIEKTRAAFAAEHRPEPFSLPRQVRLPGTGQVLTVRYVPITGSKSVRFRRGRDDVRLAGAVADSALCVKALRRWLAVNARDAFAPMLDALSLQMGIGYQRLRIAGQRTCWGSHASTGTISLNYCAQFLDPALLRYLMVHELCHGRHMNHSRRFWALVRRYEPDYRRLDRELARGWRHIPTWVGIY